MKMVFFVLVVVCSGCATVPKSYTVDEQRETRKRDLTSIHLEDGVNYQEAELLSGLYFFSFVSGCGMPGNIIDKGDRWETEMIVGYAAKKMNNHLVIDKQTGRMKLNGWPTIESPIIELVDPHMRAPVVAGLPEEYVE